MELTNGPVFKSILEKDALASQPTVSRFFNRMDEETLRQFLTVGRILRKKIYSIQMPQAVILDLDSTLLDHMANRKAEPLTFIIRAMGIIRKRQIARPWKQSVNRWEGHRSGQKGLF